MKTFVPHSPSAAQQALTTLFVRANGGIMPAAVALHVRAAGEPPQLPHCEETRDIVAVTVGLGGRLNVTVSIRTHWAPLVHRGFRFAITPSGQLVILGTHRTMPMHFFVEEGRLCCERGSPLLTATAERAAEETFIQEFVRLLGEMR